MDEEDIYAGLEIDYATGTVALSRGELENQVKELKEENQKLTAEVEKLKKQNALLQKKNEILEKNISCLYRTAQEEIKRRDERIKEIQQELLFRRTSAAAPFSRSNTGEAKTEHTRRDPRDNQTPTPRHTKEADSSANYRQGWSSNKRG